jgi:hypothetical protein
MRPIPHAHTVLTEPLTELVAVVVHATHLLLHHIDYGRRVVAA